MKKFLILIAALCLLLTACGQAAPEASPDAAAASDAAQTAGILSNFSRPTSTATALTRAFLPTTSSRW